MKGALVIDQRLDAAFVAVDRQTDHEHVVAGANDADDPSDHPSLTAHQSWEVVMPDPLEAGKLVFALPSECESEWLLAVGQDIHAELARASYVVQQLGAAVQRQEHERWIDR